MHVLPALCLVEEELAASAQLEPSRDSAHGEHALLQRRNAPVDTLGGQQDLRLHRGALARVGRCASAGRLARRECGAGHRGACRVDVCRRAAGPHDAAAPLGLPRVLRQAALVFLVVDLEQRGVGLIFSQPGGHRLALLRELGGRRLLLLALAAEHGRQAAAGAAGIVSVHAAHPLERLSPIQKQRSPLKGQRSISSASLICLAQDSGH